MFNIIKINVNTKISNKEQFSSITEEFKMIYFWPKDDNPENISKIFYLKVIIVTFIAVFIPATFTFSHAYHYRSTVNSSMVLDLVVILVILCFILLHMIMQSNLKDIVNMINQMSSASSSTEQVPLDNYLTIDFKNLTKIGRYIILSSLTIMSLLNLWETSNCENRKANKGSFESCGILVNAYLPFDYSFFPLKYFLLMWQGICAFVIGIALLNLALLTIAYIDKTVGLINYLIDSVDHFNSSIENEMEVKKYLNKMVNIHQVIIREHQQVNKHTRLGNMVRDSLGRLVIALSIFDILENGNVESMLNGVLWLIVIGILEMAGQIIINKGQELENAYLYNTKWYKIRNPKDRKSFILLYLMSQQPLSLYAGPFVQISNATLLEILKSTYSATAALIRMVK